MCPAEYELNPSLDEEVLLKKIVREFVIAVRDKNYVKIDEMIPVVFCAKDINDLLLRYYKDNRLICFKYIIYHNLITVDIMKFYILARSDNNSDVMEFILRYSKDNPLLDVEAFQFILPEMENYHDNQNRLLLMDVLELDKELTSFFY